MLQHTLVPTHSLHRGRLCVCVCVCSVTWNTRSTQKESVHIIEWNVYNLSLQLVESVTSWANRKKMKRWTGVSIRCDVLERGTHHQTRRRSMIYTHTHVHKSGTKRNIYYVCIVVVYYLFFFFWGGGGRKEQKCGNTVFRRNPFFSFFSFVFENETYFIVSNIKMSLLVFQEKNSFLTSPLLTSWDEK